MIELHSLDRNWQTEDPFIFFAHHKDHYPQGNERMEIRASLAGRIIGSDFSNLDEWSMYHGSRIPGFPTHPHRGFETITIVLKGFVDHSDSLGAAGRYGAGDVQWMTAGKGIQHSEMFPLLNENKNNPLELFQIWLNLPSCNKFVAPRYEMFWNEDIPVVNILDSEGKKTSIRIIAGDYGKQKSLSPPPSSWASDIENDLAVWIIQMEAGTQWLLPKAKTGTKRSLYFYSGKEITVNSTSVHGYKRIRFPDEKEVLIQNGNENCKLLLLQGKPINEKIVQYGPFVMNTNEEIQQAFDDFQRSKFGGWPWPQTDHVHKKSIGRFAKYIDGRMEIKES